MAKHTEPIPLCNATCNKLLKILRQGLCDRRVTEIGLYDWKGYPRPEVVAQLTESMISSWPGVKPAMVQEIETFLKAHKMSLRDEDAWNTKIPTGNK